MKGYVHTVKQLLVGQHNLTVKDGVREVECDLTPVQADLRGQAVYESHAAAEAALHAHHDDIEAGLSTVHAATDKTKHARKSGKPSHSKGEPVQAGGASAASLLLPNTPSDSAVRADAPSDAPPPAAKDAEASHEKDVKAAEAKPPAATDPSPEPERSFGDKVATVLSHMREAVSDDDHKQAKKKRH